MDSESRPSVLDGLPQRMARSLQRAGVETDHQLAAKTCRELMAMRGVGPKTVRAVLSLAGAAHLQLACGCGSDGAAGTRVCRSASATFRQVGWR